MVQLHWYLPTHPRIKQTPSCPRALAPAPSGMLPPPPHPLWSPPWLASSLLRCHNLREAFLHPLCPSITLNPFTLLYFHHSTNSHLHLSQLLIYLFTTVSSDQNIGFRAQGPVLLVRRCDTPQHLVLS